jgi:hypothetical protein
VRRINVEPLDHKQVHAMVYDIMNDTQRKTYEEFLEIDFSFEIEGLARFRVNAFNHNRGAGAVFRTIPSKILTLEQLNAPKIFADLALKPRGMVLVTGPTGSGKTTTLYSALPDERPWLGPRRVEPRRAQLRPVRLEVPGPFGRLQCHRRPPWETSPPWPFPSYTTARIYARGSLHTHPATDPPTGLTSVRPQRASLRL